MSPDQLSPDQFGSKIGRRTNLSPDLLYGGGVVQLQLHVCISIYYEFLTYGFHLQVCYNRNAIAYMILNHTAYIYNLQGIPSKMKLLFFVLLHGIRKYINFLLNGISKTKSFLLGGIRENCPIIFVGKMKTFFCSLLFFLGGGSKDTILPKKKFPIRRNREPKKFPITRFQTEVPLRRKFLPTINYTTPPVITIL